MTLLEQQDARIAFVRLFAKATLGADDDATCLRAAVILWLNSEQDGFHHAAPVGPVRDIRKKGEKPIEDPTVREGAEK